MFDDVLRRFMTDVGGARCVVLAGRDGMVVAAQPRSAEPSPELIAAAMADLFRKVDSAFRQEGLGAAAEFAVGSGDGHIVLRQVTPDFLLAAALETGRSLGRARFELRRAASELAPSLS